MPRIRRTLSCAFLVGAGALVGAACSGGGDDGAGPTSSSTVDRTDAGPSTTTTIEEGPFCDSVRALAALDSTSPADGSPQEVLAQNEQMLDLIDEAAAAAPTDAPPDVQALFDDFHAIGEAIATAGGDVEQAYATLAEADPELTDRLTDPGAHMDAVGFFAVRCGVAGL